MTVKHTPKPPFTVAAEPATGIVWQRDKREFSTLEDAKQTARIWAAKTHRRVEVYDAGAHVVERFT